MRNDKISVIIPSNNRKNWSRLIKNLKSDKIDYEILFIGPVYSHSKNKKIKIITSYLKPVQCLQIGLKYSTGNFIIQMADDCLLRGTRDPLYRLYSLSKKYPNKIISCKYSVNKIPVKSYEYNYLPWDDKTKLPIAPLVKKDDIKKVGGYDKKFIAVLSDIDLYLRLKQSNKKFFFSNVYIDEDKRFNKSNNLLPTYWSHDRSNLDRCWIKKLNGEKITLSKTRLERVKKFNNKNINKIAQGESGKWKFNNKVYYILINNKLSKILFFMITMFTNTRHYYINNIISKMKKILKKI